MGMDEQGSEALEEGLFSFLACERTFVFLKHYFLMSIVNGVEVEDSYKTLHIYCLQGPTILHFAKKVLFKTKTKILHIVEIPPFPETTCC